jgi:hypothetical protein
VIGDHGDGCIELHNLAYAFHGFCLGVIKETSFFIEINEEEVKASSL